MVAPNNEPSIGTSSLERLENFCQVVLYNDDFNEADYVSRCLQQVFGHSEPLAIKIMQEAHFNGKAIAEVEAATPAKLHRDQLLSMSLTATVEKI